MDHRGPGNLLLFSSHIAHPASSPPLLKQAWFIPDSGNALLLIPPWLVPLVSQVSTPLPLPKGPFLSTWLLSHAIVFFTRDPDSYLNVYLVWPTILSLLTVPVLSTIPSQRLPQCRAQRRGSVDGFNTPDEPLGQQSKGTCLLPTLCQLHNHT